MERRSLTSPTAIFPNEMTNSLHLAPSCSQPQLQGSPNIRNPHRLLMQSQPSTAHLATFSLEFLCPQAQVDIGTAETSRHAGRCQLSHCAKFARLYQESRAGESRPGMKATKYTNDVRCRVCNNPLRFSAISSKMPLFGTNNTQKKSQCVLPRSFYALAYALLP